MKSSSFDLINYFLKTPHKKVFCYSWNRDTDQPKLQNINPELWNHLVSIGKEFSVDVTKISPEISRVVSTLKQIPLGTGIDPNHLQILMSVPFPSVFQTDKIHNLERTWWQITPHQVDVFIHRHLYHLEKVDDVIHVLDGSALMINNVISTIGWPDISLDPIFFQYFFNSCYEKMVLQPVLILLAQEFIYTLSDPDIDLAVLLKPKLLARLCKKPKAIIDPGIRDISFDDETQCWTTYSPLGSVLKTTNQRVTILQHKH